MIKSQQLVVKTVEDTMLFLKQQSLLLQSANKFSHPDPVYHSCIKQMEGLLGAEKSYLNKLESKTKVL